MIGSITPGTKLPGEPSARNGHARFEAAGAGDGAFGLPRQPSTLLKRLCLPPEFQTATLQTLRNRILLMPAQLVRSDNRPRLAMPASGPREVAWKYALRQIERLKL